MGTRLFEEAFVFPLEAGEPAAAVDKVLAAARPGRVRLRIDVELQRLAFRPVGRIGDELGAVGHHHLDAVIVGVDVPFHGVLPCKLRSLRWGRAYNGSSPRAQGCAGRARAFDLSLLSLLPYIPPRIEEAYA